jgi:hypothetical protein
MLTYHTEKYTPKAPTTQATKAVRLNVTHVRLNLLTAAISIL